MARRVDTYTTYTLSQGARKDDLMRGSLEKKRGFTLVEIIISMLLLSTVVAGMLVVFVVGRRSVGLAGHNVQAMDFARETIDELRGRVGGYLWEPSDTSLDGSEEGTAHDIGLPDGCELLRIDSNANRSYTVWDIDADPDYDSDGDGDYTNDTDYKRVTVTVNWEEPEP